ncbi:MAG: cache domain-containing protein [Pseudomonadota bacterium]
MTFRTKLLTITILPVLFISIAALWLIDSQSRKLAEKQGVVVENMIRQSKRVELQNYVNLARAAVQPFYNWDNVSRLQAQKQVADVVTNMAFGEDGYFFISRSNGGVLENPLLSELESQGKFETYAAEASLLANGFLDSDRRHGDLYQYLWNKPTSGTKAEKLGQSVYLDDWDWVIGSGIYMDDVAAQIGQVQLQLEENVKQTRWVLVGLAIGAVALTSLLLALVRFSEQKFADQRLKALTSEIVDAQENERKRVSTELHDGISQLLVSARYGLDIAYENAKDNRVVADPVSKSMEAISTAISEIRRISMALRPSILDDMGLAAAMTSLAKDFEAQTGILVKVSAENVGDALNDREKTTLYRVTQEALANIAKHSGATRAEIDLTRNSKGVFVEVSDDGSGITGTSKEKIIGGMGLRNMKERLESHNGRFDIIPSSRQSGVTLRMHLPGNNNSDPGSEILAAE